MERVLLKSCCGGKTYELILDKPITKDCLSVFSENGYKISERYSLVGVFFVLKDGLTASARFGGNKVRISCGGNSNCSILVDHLENTFKQI